MTDSGLQPDCMAVLQWSFWENIFAACAGGLPTDTVELLGY